MPVPHQNRVAPAALPGKNSGPANAPQVVPANGEGSALLADDGSGSSSKGPRHFAGKAHASVSEDLDKFDEMMKADPRSVLVARRDELRKAVASGKAGAAKGKKGTGPEEELAQIEAELKGALRPSDEIMGELVERVQAREAEQTPADQEGAEQAVHEVVSEAASELSVADESRREDQFMEQVLQRSVAEREIVAARQRVRLEKEGMRAHREARNAAYEEHQAELAAEREKRVAEIAEEEREAYGKQLESARQHIAELEIKRAMEKSLKRQAQIRQMMDEMVDLAVAVGQQRAETTQRNTPWGSSPESFVTNADADVLGTVPQYREWALRWVGGLDIVWEPTYDAAAEEEREAPMRQLDAAQLALYLHSDAGFALSAHTDRDPTTDSEIAGLAELAANDGEQSLSKLMSELSMVVDGDLAQGGFSELLHPRSPQELAEARAVRAAEVQRKRDLRKARENAPLQPLRVVVVGPRLSGQTATAQALSTVYSLVVVVASDILNEAVKVLGENDAEVLDAKGNLWKKAADFATKALAVGKSVSPKDSALLIATYLTELEQNPPSDPEKPPFGGWVLDGYPRTAIELGALEEALGGTNPTGKRGKGPPPIFTSQLDVIVTMNCPMEVSLERGSKLQTTSDESPLDTLKEDSPERLSSNASLSSKTSGKSNRSNRSKGKEMSEPPAPPSSVATLTAELEGYSTEFEQLRNILDGIIGRFDAALAKKEQEGEEADKPAAKNVATLQTLLASSPRVAAVVEVSSKMSEEDVAVSPQLRIQSIVDEQRQMAATQEADAALAEQERIAREQREAEEENLLTAKAEREAQVEEAAKGNPKSRQKSRGGGGKRPDAPAVSESMANLKEQADAIEGQRAREEQERQDAERAMAQSKEKAILTNPLALFQKCHQKGTDDVRSSAEHIVRSVERFEQHYAQELCALMRSLRDQQEVAAKYSSSACDEFVSFMNAQGAEGDDDSNFQKAFDSFVADLSLQEASLAEAVEARTARDSDQEGRATSSRGRKPKPFKGEGELSKFEDAGSDDRSAARVLIESKLDELKQNLWAVSDSRRASATMHLEKVTSLTEGSLVEQVGEEQRVFSAFLKLEKDRLAVSAAFLRDATAIVLNERKIASSGQAAQPPAEGSETADGLKLDLPAIVESFFTEGDDAGSTNVSAAESAASVKPEEPAKKAPEKKRGAAAKRDAQKLQQSAVLDGELRDRVIAVLYPDEIQRADPRSLAAEISARVKADCNLEDTAKVLTQALDIASGNGPMTARRPGDTKIAAKHKPQRKKGFPEPVDLPEPPSWLSAEDATALAVMARDQVTLDQNLQAEYETALQAAQEAYEAAVKAAEDAKAAAEAAAEAEEQKPPLTARDKKGAKGKAAQPEPEEVVELVDPADLKPAEVPEPDAIDHFQALLISASNEVTTAYEKRIERLKDVFLQRMAQVLDASFVRTASNMDMWMGRRYQQEVKNVDNILDFVVKADSQGFIPPDATAVARLHAAIDVLRRVKVDSLRFTIEEES